jgi:hypothetical protein
VPNFVEIGRSQHVPLRFKTHLQPDNRERIIFHAVQSNPFLANRCGYLHSSSACTWFAAALG